MNQQSPQNYEFDDEIDLTDYIRIIIKRKWVIIIGTVLCLIGGGIYSSTQKIPYEARASLLVVPPPYKTELTPPTFTMDVYKALAKAQDLMQSVIDSLDLHNREGQPISIPQMNGLLSTEIVQSETAGNLTGAGPSMMHLVATSTDTATLSPVAVVNVWAELFMLKNNGISSQETGGSYDFISKQYDIAKMNLQTAENALLELNKLHQTEILKADLTPANAKLVEYQTNIVNTRLELSNLEESLEIQEQQLMALETPDGEWVGSLDVNGYGGINRHLLNNDHKRILDICVRNRDLVKSLRKQVLSFEDRHDLTLMAEDLTVKRTTLVAYMNELSQMEVDMASVSQALEALKDNEGSGFTGSFMVETLPPEALREFASLRLGYNLLTPRHKYLVIEIERLKTETDSLENIYTNNTLELALMKEKLITAEQAYTALLNLHRDSKSQINNLKISINALRPKVENLEQKRQTLQHRTESLAFEIANQELERTRLNREIAVYQSSFEKFAGLLENARVAKANQPSDIKIVARAVTQTQTSSQFPVAIIAAGCGAVAMIFFAFLFEYVENAKEKIRNEDLAR